VRARAMLKAERSGACVERSAQWSCLPRTSRGGRWEQAEGTGQRRPVAGPASRGETRRKQRRAPKKSFREIRRDGVRAGVAKLTGDWRLCAAQPATRTEPRGVSSAEQGVDRNSNDKISQNLNCAKDFVNTKVVEDRLSFKFYVWGLVWFTMD